MGKTDGKGIKSVSSEILALNLASKWRYSAKINIYPLYLVWENKQAVDYSAVYLAVKLQDKRRKSLTRSIITGLFWRDGKKLVQGR